jgi:hypothetical protein
VEEEAVTAPTAEDRQLAIDVLTQRFIEAGKDPAESAEVAAAVVDQAIADRQAGGGPGQAGLSSDHREGA